jgi:hypothetical protein
MRWTVVATMLVAGAFVGCGRSRPTFEYEEPITITHTADVPAAPAASATSTTVPSRPSSWVRGGTK